jgi:hypothetical protein
MQQALQAEINKVLNDQMKRHGVTSAFINAPVTVTGNTQHGGPGSNQMQGSVSGTVNQTTTNQSPTHIQGNQIHQTGSGPCAPNVAGVGGNVTINADCPGKQ